MKVRIRASTSRVVSMLLGLWVHDRLAAGELRRPVFARRSEPLGIINSYGVCYAASVIQLFEAVRHAIPDSFEAVLSDAQDELLSGYGEAITTASYSPAGYFVHRLIDPSRFIEPWVRLCEKKYARVLVQRVVKRDGTIEERELRPRLVNRGTGGDPLELFELMLKKIAGAEQALRREPLFSELQYVDTIDCFMPGGEVIRSRFVERAFERYACAEKVLWPRFIAIGVRGKDTILQQMLSLTMPVRPVLPGVPQYRLLGAIYALPSFSIHLSDILSRNYSFDDMHGIALVRYDERWYLCDNRTITPFAHEQAVEEWIDLQSRTSYHGIGIPEGSKAIIPRVLIYERVDQK